MTPALATALTLLAAHKRRQEALTTWPPARRLKFFAIADDLHRAARIAWADAEFIAYLDLKESLP